MAETRWEIIDGALVITMEKAVPTFRRSDHWDRLFATGPRVDTALLPLSLPSIADGRRLLFFWRRLRPPA